MGVCAYVQFSRHIIHIITNTHRAMKKLTRLYNSIGKDARLKYTYTIARRYCKVVKCLKEHTRIRDIAEYLVSQLGTQVHP